MKLSFRFSLIALLFCSLFFVGCEEDPPIVEPPIVTPPVPPDVDFASGTGLTTGDFELDVAETLLRVGIIAATGDAELNSLSVTRDGVLMSPDDLRIFTTVGDTGTEIDPVNNPQAITGDARNGFTWEIRVRTPAFGENSDYAFTVTDADGESDEVSLNLSAVMPTTPLDTMLMGVLFNSSGPTGTGGLDLDAGIGTGSMSMLAEIRDLGGVGANNWRRQITGVNNSVIRTLNSSSVDNFDFANVTTQESILDFYNDGEDLADDGNGNFVTDPIQAGDTFIVLNPTGDDDGGERYYLIQIAEVNEVAADNSDNYVIDIKY